SPRRMARTDALRSYALGRAGAPLSNRRGHGSRDAPRVARRSRLDRRAAFRGSRRLPRNSGAGSALVAGRGASVFRVVLAHAATGRRRAAGASAVVLHVAAVPARSAKATLPRDSIAAVRRLSPIAHRPNERIHAAP